MFDELIVSTHNVLDKEFCQHCIDKFELDDRKHLGAVGSKPTNAVEIKRSMDLKISAHDDWKEEDGVFFKALYDNVVLYKDYIKDKFNNNFLGGFTDISDTGYQMQKTRPGEYYTWHDDFMHQEGLGSRHLTFIFYMNDVEYEGQTEFASGYKVKPEMGKIVLFPSTWTYLHRGISPKKEVKYIVTGWVFDGSGKS